MTIEDVAIYFIFISNNSSYSSCLNCTGKSCRNSLINSMKLNCMIYLTEITYYAIYGKPMLEEKIKCSNNYFIQYDTNDNYFNHKFFNEKIKYPSNKRIEYACKTLSKEIKQLIRTAYDLFSNTSCEELMTFCCFTEPFTESIKRNYKWIDKRLFKFYQT